MPNSYAPCELSNNLQPLAELALNLRWTWSHGSDALWRSLDAEAWELTRNPWLILNTVSQAHLEQAIQNPQFKEKLDHCINSLRDYQNDPGWYSETFNGLGPNSIAYFSMEFGIGEALPLYAGGLGMLAGDHLKTASDLGVPLVGVGLLYFQGYIRQMLSTDNWQLEFFPHIDSTNLPITPVRDATGTLLRIPVELPGRELMLRVWQAQVGKVTLYLLDSSDPFNSPADQGITSRLYHEASEIRLLQEIVLGIGGWRMLATLGIHPKVCHLNEGHAAFVVLERARQFMHDNSVTFQQALCATRAGNIFTTHTPIAAAFDQFDKALITQYFCPLAQELGLSMEELLGLGRQDPKHNHSTFNMAYLALRGSSLVNGVSKLHGIVSQQLFRGLFPRWPQQEVPIQSITNGVHTPSWDSKWADELWTQACGQQRWLGEQEGHDEAICSISDEDIWACRAKERQSLVDYARKRLARQLGQNGATPDVLEQATHVLDPNALTLGFARRFTAYKRPDLLFHDQERLTRILTQAEHPVQLVIAGKTHPGDLEGKRLLQTVARFTKQEKIKHRVVFLEDYDISLAQQMVQGIDVWINTPRLTWEACGTSGMKVLVNGGLNLSELDGWWAEAFSPDVGWAFNEQTIGETGTTEELDKRQAQELYRLLEQEVIPEFFHRDEQGIPRAWVERIRTSMANLASQYSSNRMVREYVERCYIPSASAVKRRCKDKAALAIELGHWHKTLASNWDELHFGDIQLHQDGELLHYQVQVYLGDIPPEWIRVELYTELEDKEQIKLGMQRTHEIAGAINGFIYTADVAYSEPAKNFIPRIIPAHPDSHIPLEENHILWQR